MGNDQSNWLAAVLSQIFSSDPEERKKEGDPGISGRNHLIGASHPLDRERLIDEIVVIYCGESVSTT